MIELVLAEKEDSELITRLVCIAREAERINNLIAKTKLPHGEAHFLSWQLVAKKAAGYGMDLQELEHISAKLEPGRGKEGIGRGLSLTEALQKIAVHMLAAAQVVKATQGAGSSAPYISKEYAAVIFLEAFEALP